LLHGNGLPRHVRREFDGYVQCGEPTSGFAWLQCTSCDHHKLVPFSYKGRGFCPCCGGRRMAAFAARMVDGILPCLHVRQWVLSLPWDIRALLAWRHPLTRGVPRVAFRVIQRFYRDRVAATAGVQGAGSGSVTVLSRFGSDLRLNPHFHMLVLNGAYVRDEAIGLVGFHKTPAPSTEDVERVAEQIAIKSAAWLGRQGVEDFQEPDPDELQLTLQAAAIAGRSALSTRASQRVRRVQTLGGRRFALPPLLTTKRHRVEALVYAEPCQVRTLRCVRLLDTKTKRWPA
jgi:hypothetical protein